VAKSQVRVSDQLNLLPNLLLVTYKATLKMQVKMYASGRQTSFAFLRYTFFLLILKDGFICEQQ